MSGVEIKASVKHKIINISEIRVRYRFDDFIAIDMRTRWGDQTKKGNQ